MVAIAIIKPGQGSMLRAIRTRAQPMSFGQCDDENGGGMKGMEAGVLDISQRQAQRFLVSGLTDLLGCFFLHCYCFSSCGILSFGRTGE